MALTNEELERYSRQIALKEVGYRGQKRLAESSVFIAGAGGLGSPAALYLAASGVGRIGIADADVVDLSNLQRQVIHTTADIGRPKVQSAAETMRAINPHVQVDTYHTLLTSANILDIIRGYDFVIDGTDNIAAKFLINDACVMANIPFASGGILRFRGQLMTVLPHETPCYRCVYGDPAYAGKAPSCREAGVVGAIAGMVGSLQALEAVKYLTGAGDLLTGRIYTIDTLTWTPRIIPLPPRGEGCAVCSEHPTITELVDYAPPVCELGAHGSE